jgi:hypothetical protein
VRGRQPEFLAPLGPALASRTRESRQSLPGEDFFAPALPRVGDSGARPLDPRLPAWYKPPTVKRTATPVSESNRALGATLGRGTFTAYYWRFT